MKKTAQIRTTVTCSLDAYRRLGEIAPTQKPAETLRQIVEAMIYFKGNYYDFLSLIGGSQKKRD
tara:strand:- start:180 stop:371 length:192 start_codon:yes stop_codon:yes gene_type:complete